MSLGVSMSLVWLKQLKMTVLHHPFLKLIYLQKIPTQNLMTAINSTKMFHQIARLNQRLIVL